MLKIGKFGSFGIFPLKKWPQNENEASFWNNLPLNIHYNTRKPNKIISITLINQIYSIENAGNLTIGGFMHLKLDKFSAFSCRSFWLPMVMEVILYGFLASLGIFLEGILQKLVSFLLFGLLWRGKIANKAPKTPNFPIFSIFRALHMGTQGNDTNYI